MRKIYVVLIILGVLLAIGCAVFVTYVYPKVIKPVQDYNKAVELYNDGQYVLAALRFEKLGDQDEMARIAWMLAGEECFVKGELAQARTFYLKSGAGNEKLADIDRAYLRRGNEAYLNDDYFEAESCYSCISYGSVNTSELDQTRMSCIRRLLQADDYDTAARVSRFCSSSASGELSKIWFDRGSEALDELDINGAAVCMSHAVAYSGDRDELILSCDSLYLAASTKARGEGDHDLAARFLDLVSTGH